MRSHKAKLMDSNLAVFLKKSSPVPSSTHLETTSRYVTIIYTVKVIRGDVINKAERARAVA